MVNNDYGMQDTVGQATGPWEAESEDDRGAVPVVWNLDTGFHEGALPTADVQTKLRRLTAVNYNNCNWSWLLDLNRPPEPPVTRKVLASSKIHPAFEPEEHAQAGVLSTTDLGKSRVSGRTVPTKGKRDPAQCSRVLRSEVDSDFL